MIQQNKLQLFLSYIFIYIDALFRNVYLVTSHFFLKMYFTGRKGEKTYLQKESVKKNPVNNICLQKNLVFRAF